MRSDRFYYYFVGLALAWVSARAVRNVTSSPEVWKFFKIRAVLKRKVFLPVRWTFTTFQFFYFFWFVCLCIWSVNFKWILNFQRHNWYISEVIHSVKIVLIVWPKIPQMPQNISPQFDCPSPKVSDFWKKALSGFP